MSLNLPILHLHNHSAIPAKEAFRHIQEKGYAFCLYRLPNTQAFQLIAGQYRSLKSFSEKNIFLVRPFSGNHIHGIYPEWHISVSAEDLPEHIDLYHREPPKMFTSDRTSYMRLVSQAIEAIEAGAFEKVVTSRCQYYRWDKTFSTKSLFLTLTERYPQAFVYLLSIPEHGSWMGATPELLLKKVDNILETVALAGTKAAAQGKQAFTTKEEHEQAVVTDYILEKLKKWTHAISVSGPDLQQAGHLTHLITRFKAQVETEFNLLPLLEELHPTPAVCGLPKEAARHFILENEHYPRSLYSGYLGYMGEQNSHIFVNLRCMQLFEDRALLYGGGGIVKGSVPEQEWEETAQKINTLLQYLPA